MCDKFQSGRSVETFEEVKEMVVDMLMVFNRNWSQELCPFSSPHRTVRMSLATTETGEAPWNLSWNTSSGVFSGYSDFLPSMIEWL